MIQDTLRRVRQEYERAFNEVICDDLQTKIIVGSPVDTGRFKTSWQVITMNPHEFKFHIRNPVKYGILLWRHKKSLKGWSPKGGDLLLFEARAELERRFDLLNNQNNQV